MSDTLKRKPDHPAEQPKKHCRCVSCKTLSTDWRLCDSCDAPNCATCIQACVGCSYETCDRCSNTCYRCESTEICYGCSNSCDVCQETFCDDCWDRLNTGQCLRCLCSVCVACVKRHTKLEFQRWLMVYFILVLDCSNPALVNAIAYARPVSK